MTNSVLSEGSAITALLTAIGADPAAILAPETGPG